MRMCYRLWLYSRRVDHVMLFCWVHSRMVHYVGVAIGYVQQHVCHAHAYLNLFTLHVLHGLFN